jgi:hypothetical protein
MSRASLCVLFAFAALPLAAHATDMSAVGNWSGALHRGEAAYRVNFHVQAAPGGRLTGSVSGLPGDDYTPVPAAVETSGDTLVIDAGGGRYSGVWDQALGAWVGSWKQADLSEPLALRWETNNAVNAISPSTQSRIVTFTQQGLLPPVNSSAGGGAVIMAPPAP